MPNPHGEFTLVPLGDGTFAFDIHFDTVADFVVFLAQIRGSDDAVIQALTKQLTDSTNKLADAESSAT